MGAKISVDSATMMNKGLEIIEAHHLFGMPEPAIEVVVHPQSIVHSLVAFTDGSILAQLGEPDMRIPIAYALGWPGRLATGVAELDLCARPASSSSRPTRARFPALRLARLALRRRRRPTILNAANEVAVAAFLARRIGFLDIARTVGQVLERLTGAPCDDLEAVLAYDAEARRLAADASGESGGAGAPLKDPRAHARDHHAVSDPVPARPVGRRVRARVRALLGGAAQRRADRGVLDRLRPGAVRPQRPPRHPLEVQRRSRSAAT